MGSSMNETPKRHILGLKHVVWRIDRQNRSTCAVSTRAEEYSKKCIPKKPKRVFSRVRPDHPPCRSATWICMCRHTRDVVIHSKFHWNPFRGFGAPLGQNLAFPITLAIRFYNSLYYRTSRHSRDTVAGFFFTSPDLFCHGRKRTLMSRCLNIIVCFQSWETPERWKRLHCRLSQWSRHVV